MNDRLPIAVYIYMKQLYECHNQCLFLHRTFLDYLSDVTVELM